MKAHEELAFSPAGPSGSESDASETQSPHWSLAPFGWQQEQQQTQRLQQQRRPPGGRRREHSKDVARAQLERGPHDGCQEEGGQLCELAVPQPSPWQSATSWCCQSYEQAVTRLGAGRLWGAALSAVLLVLVCWGYAHLASGGQLAPEYAAAAGKRQQCQLQLDGSPWERHCQRLQRVCVDQGKLILYDDEYQQLDNRRAGQLPKLLVDSSKIYEYPWRTTTSTASRSRSDNADAADEGADSWQPDRRLLYYVLEPNKNRRIDALPLRPAAAQEAAPYLQDPSFSTCTVPLLIVPSWRNNFFHIFKDLAAVYYALMRRTPWRQHIKLVVVTPEGLPMTQPEAQLLPVLSRLSVQTFAEFSRRLLPGYKIGQELEQQQAPASWEGGEQRCFQDVFFCGQKIELARGAPREHEAAWSEAERTTALAKAVPIEPFSYGQAVVHYEMQQPREGQAAEDGISLQVAAAAAAPKPEQEERSKSSGRLKVLLMKRGGEGRQILNADELLEQCNAWQYRAPNGTAIATADCREVSMPDLAAGVAAARKADVFIGMHGANLGNSWMMRPGSSIIEFIPYQFEGVRGSFVFSTMNALDTTSKLLWWVAVSCDPATSTPGPDEAAGTGLEEWWPRDRNTRVPWAVVDTMLQQVVSAGGSKQQYMEHWHNGTQRFNFDAAGVVGRGGGCPAPSPAAA